MTRALSISFGGTFGGSRQLGPFPCLRFEGEVIRAAPGGPVIARHQARAWVVEGKGYTRLDCDARVCLHLERIDGTASKTYGAFESFSCVDGVAYADRDIFAFVDRGLGDWYCRDDERHWPLLVVAPAP